MPRISIKGLLFKDLENLYESTKTSIFDKSKLSREEFESKENEIFETFISIMLDEYRQHFTINFQTFHKSILATQKAIAKIYHRPFQFYFSYLSTCHRIVESIFEQIHELPHNQTDSIAVSLFSHLLRKADQIGIMLLNGYDDGALIIWRSFYEFALTLKLLAERDDNELSSLFIQHNIRHAKKLNESYNSRLTDHGFDEIDAKESEIIIQEFDRLFLEYGKSFLESEYGWASKIPELKNKATLRQIEELVGMSRFRPFYIWASAYSHANFEVFKKVVIEDKILASEIKNVQPSLEDLIDPMQITLAVLQEVTESFLNLVSHEDEAELNSDLLNKLYLQLINYFQSEGN